MQKLLGTISVCAISLLMFTDCYAQTTHQHHTMFAFTENSVPTFSGFYGSLGLGYNMLAGDVDYTSVITPTSGGSQLMLNGSASKSSGVVSGLLKFGYSLRFQPQMYIGLAGFYNAAGSQTLVSSAISYNSQSGSIDVKETAGSSYGFLLQPGYILNNNKSAVYLNLGMEFTAVTVKTTAANSAGEIDSTSASATRSINNLKLGVGYQQHLNLGKFKGANNLMWFAEANFNPSASGNISQVSGADLPPMRNEVIKAKLANTQLVAGINYYF